MLVAASAVGLGRVQLPRQSSDEEKKTTTGRNDPSELAAGQKERERIRGELERSESAAAGFEPRIWT